jgi:hypothetical protein
MAITIDFNTRVINVPKSFMTQINPTLYELDVNALRLELKNIEDADGITYPDTHRHNTEVVLAGTTYARSVEFINGFTITFEDGQYAVRCIGANHNISDVKNLNQVSLIIGNSAGLQTVNVGGGVGTVAEVADAVWNAISSNYLTVGSTGAKLAAAGSAGDPWTTDLTTYNTPGTAGFIAKSTQSNTTTIPTVEQIANQVRTELSPELTHILAIESNPGLTTAQATMLLEMYVLLGLDPTKPLVVSTNSRTAGTIVQNIASDQFSTQVQRV